MKNRLLTTVSIATLLLLAEGLWVYAFLPRPADASRSAAGTYSLPAGNPVVTGTSISSTWANNTLSDLSTEMSDSKSRSGKGDFTAPVRGADGSVSSPTWSWTNDTGSGEYRIGSGDFGWAIAGTKKLELTSSLFTVTPAASFLSALTTTVAAATAIKALSGASGSNTDIAIGRTATEARLGVSAGASQYATGTAAGDIILGTLGTKLWFDTNTGSGTPSLAIAAANGGVIIGGGTTIAQIITGTGTYNGGTPATFTATVASGAKCVASKVQTGGAAAAAVSLSGTTLTVTSSAAGDTGNANYFCF